MTGLLFWPLADVAGGPLGAAAARGSAALLGWVPFLNPVKLPVGARLWMFLPLALCIALVYRATRARSLKKLVWGTLITFVNISIGMIAIALAFYLVNQAALRLMP